MSGSNSSDPGLRVAPADPLALTVHALPAAQAAQRRGRYTVLLVLLACVAPVFASYLLYYVVRPEARNNYATLIQPSRGLPAELGLRSLDGSPVSSASLKGQWLLIVVAGAGCDAVCEALLYEQRQLREMTGREKGRIDRVWLVNDEAEVRQPILRALQTGDPATVLRAPAAALAAWLRPEPGQPLEASIYLVDPMGEWMMRTPVQPDPVRFRKDLDRLLRASAFWDRPGRGS